MIMNLNYRSDNHRPKRELLVIALADKVSANLRLMYSRKADVTWAEIFFFHPLNLDDIMPSIPTQYGNIMVPVPER